MFKLVVLSGVVAAATAQSDGMDIEATNRKVIMNVGKGSVVQRTKSSDITISEVKGVADSQANIVNSMSSQINDLKLAAGEMGEATEYVKTVGDDLNDLAQKLTQSSDQLDMIIDTAHQEMDAAKKEFHNKLEAAEAELDNQIEEEFKALHAELMAQSKELTKQFVDRLDEAQTNQHKVEDETDALLEQLAKHEECSAQGRLYDSDKDECAYGSGPDSLKAELIPRLTHRAFNNGDGRDHGWIHNHWIKFDKKVDDSYVRVTLQDNFRIHGHTAHALWQIMFCDGNGNNCAHCNTPNRINFHKWANHQHNWWMNDHVGCSVHGICKKTDNFDLRKGTYMIKIHLEANRYDIYTGHNQNNAFMVDEVYVSNM